MLLLYGTGLTLGCLDRPNEREPSAGPVRVTPGRLWDTSVYRPFLVSSPLRPAPTDLAAEAFRGPAAGDLEMGLTALRVRYRSVRNETEIIERLLARPFEAEAEWASDLAASTFSEGQRYATKTIL